MLKTEFALVPPGSAPERARTMLLVRSGGMTLEDVIGRPGSTNQLRLGDVAWSAESRGDTERGTAAAVTLGLATVLLLLVALVAGAGFVVVAQRRLRQLGMLAAVGATTRHLRLVVVANGFIVGVVAAFVGTLLALGGWALVVNPLERAAGHRIGVGDVPLYVVGVGAVLAVVTGTAAAWWPARVVARVPVMAALSERPPRPKPAHRSAIAALVFLTIGFIAIAIAVDTKDGDTNAPVFVGGLIAVAVGVLAISPAAVRAIAAMATRLPVATRLALRDLGRHQARSGAALAAVSLGLGISVTIVVIAAAAQDGGTRAIWAPDKCSSASATATSSTGRSRFGRPSKSPSSSPASPTSALASAATRPSPSTQ